MISFDKLKELRIERELTQFELANRLNISQSAISAYEKNEREPIAKVLAIYADFFEVSIDYLLGRENDFGQIIINKNSETINLSDSDKEILDLFDSLDPYDRELFLLQLRAIKHKSVKA